MRNALPILLLLAIVGAAAAWWMFAEDADAPPPADAPSTPRAGAPPDPAPIERTVAAAPPVKIEPPAVTNEPTAAAPPPAAAAPDNVELRVREVKTQQPVAAFRWRFKTAGATAKGDGTAGAAALRLAPGAVGQLFVEADGHEPWTRDLTAPPLNAPPAAIDVFLVPTAPATGITLNVRDTANKPVTNVRVDAFALAPEARTSNTWMLGNPLWSRRTSAPDGHYVLPDLAPGEYGIRVTAVDDRGGPLAILPFTSRYELTGSNGFIEDVTLGPGCVLVLDLVDAAGNRLDPAAVGTVVLQLQIPGGTLVSRRWTVTNGAVAASAIDVVPGVGSVTLADAVPAGAYDLHVTVPNRTPVVQRLTLRAGEVPVERVVVP